MTVRSTAAMLMIFGLALTPGLTAPLKSRPTATPVRPIPIRPFPISLHGGEIHGTILAFGTAGEGFVAGGRSLPVPIFLPDISVHLETTASTAVGPTVKTDYDGAFAVPHQLRGKYKLCWAAIGFTSGCTKEFALGATTLSLKPIVIVPKAGVVYGRVALKDGAACRFVMPLFGRNLTAEVQAIAPGGFSGAVHANSSGYYLMPGVPNGSVGIKARCEGALVSAAATLGGVTNVNLTIPNSRPKVNSVYALQGGRMVRAAAVGSTIQMSAKVADGNGYAMHYSWALDPASPGFASADSPNVTWKVPATGNGQAAIYMLAHDDKGGNAFWRVALSTTPNRIRFGGHVLANDAPLLKDATVSINGVTAHTDAKGNFGLFLHGEAPRYVVTITKSGYQMLSRALYAPAPQANFKLYRAQDITVDPKKPIKLAEKRENERQGVQIEIPANAIATGAHGLGARATSPLHVKIASYNRKDADDQIPGDYGGIDKNGKGAALQSFGAVDVAIDDGAGHPFNLAPGTQATVRVPIDPSEVAGAPASIPVWHYDSEKGMWIEDGLAHKVGSFFETKVTHFSAVNMDLAFGTAACTIINVDTGIMPVPFRLRMTALTGPAQVQNDHQNQIISDAVNVVVREPPGIQVKFEVVDSNGSIVPNATQTVAVGSATPDGAMWAPPPNPPYDCTSQVNYDEHTVQGIFPASPNGFLAYQTPAAYLNPVTADPLATAYYHAIDPGGTKTAAGDVNDFANWKELNGFNRGGFGRIAYQNLYDLGFGRDMYMQTGGHTGTCGACVAFYVSNYHDANEAGSASSGLIATVAMEYGPRDETGPTYIRFYVFGANGAISNTAALDDFGPKYVPALCVICHNGDIASNATTSNIASSGGNLVFARFIPFDLDSFAYPTDPVLLTAHPELSEANQRAAAGPVHLMNKTIVQDSNVSAAETNLITAWYGHEGATSGSYSIFNGGVVPNDWSGHASLYSDVVKTSCRACHTTRDPADPNAFQDISWGSFAALDGDAGFVRILACSSPTASHPMPQAERTFARFWLSTNPNAPITLGNAGLTGWGPAGCP